MRVKAKDLRKFSQVELDKKMLELRKALMKANAQVATGTVPENPGDVKNLKKGIAIINTLKTEKNKGGVTKK
jgi:large subunit ribosomal protein L29